MIKKNHHDAEIFNCQNSPETFFHGKTALITGGAKRLGAAIAAALADRGCRVIIHYNGDQRAAETFATILNRRRADSAFCVRGDFSDEETPVKIFRETQKILPKKRAVDYLINNAAAYPENLTANIRFADFAETQKINFFAPLQLSRIFAAQAPAGAAIVNLLDARLSGGDREHFAYHFSKRNLAALTRIFAWEFAPKIRVNAVAPGLILPPKKLKSAAAKSKWLNDRRASNPLNAYGTPAQIAAAVQFLLNADFITGEILYVDGGRNLRAQFYR